jgi:hypothetical protein
MSNANNDRETALTDKHEATIDNIQNLQEIERYMFMNLQNISGNDQDAETQRADIRRRINELSTIRTNLFSKMKDYYLNAENVKNNNEATLSDKTELAMTVEKEISEIKKRLGDLRDEKVNKKRLVQLGEYEYERYQEHKDIMKVLVYASLAVLVVLYSKSFGLPSIISNLVIILIVAYVIYNLGSRVYWNIRRNNMDYSKIDQFDIKVRDDMKYKLLDWRKLFRDLLGDDLCLSDIKNTMSENNAQVNVYGNSGENAEEEGFANFVSDNEEKQYYFI